MNDQQKLERIAMIIEGVDQRCMAADGPVTPTLQEMRQSEISEIYKIASQPKNPADECHTWVPDKIGLGYHCRKCGEPKRR